jgi:hypothetical protein
MGVRIAPGKSCERVAPHRVLQAAVAPVSLSALTFVVEAVPA